MTCEDDLLELCEGWRALSLAEGAAIEVEDWPRVFDCQQAKRALQPRIARLVAREAADEPEREAWRRYLCAWGRELINLEMGNSGILCRKRERLESERQALTHQAASLRRLQRSYRPAAPAHWQTYS